VLPVAGATIVSFSNENALLIKYPCCDVTLFFCIAKLKIPHNGEKADKARIPQSERLPLSVVMSAVYFECNQTIAS
jgi:hypothetical protein